MIVADEDEMPLRGAPPDVILRFLRKNGGTITIPDVIVYTGWDPARIKAAFAELHANGRAVLTGGENRGWRLQMPAVP